MLHVVHQNVQVAIVLCHATHLTNELVVQLRHVLNLIEKMLLLLSLEYLVLGYYLDCVECLAIFLWGHLGHPLVSLGLL